MFDFADLEERTCAKFEAERLLGCLTERQRAIIKARFYDNSTLREAGEEVCGGRSAERVRQIEQHALRKMRAAARQRHLDTDSAPIRLQRRTPPPPLDDEQLIEAAMEHVQTREAAIELARYWIQTGA